MNRLGLFGAAFLFSTGGAAIKAASLTGWQVASFRAGIAAVALYLVMPGARKGWTWGTFAVGCAYAATLILFVLANKATTSANAILLQSTSPLYLLLLGPLLLKERIEKADVLVIALIAAGGFLLLSGPELGAKTAPDPVHGNLYAAAAGVTWALTIAGLRWMGKRDQNANLSEASVIVGNIICFLAALPMALPVTHATGADIAVVLYLGIFQVGLAYFLLTRSLRYVPALEAATLLLAEPVFNPMWSWFVHGERPGPLALPGGALIVLAAFGGTWWKSRSG